MKLFLDANTYFDTKQAIDISIPMSNKANGAKAWYVNDIVIEPVRANGYVGSVEEGGSVNFRNIQFNPHGNGTHTECLGHITREVYSINEHLKDFFFHAILVSISPTLMENGDFVITPQQLKDAISNQKTEALVLRTLPNDSKKLSMDYSNTNPPYVDVTCIEVLNEAGVQHLLIDLPSVDRENDEGKLAMHHAFWQLPNNPQFNKTITEFIFVADEIHDGKYILELQVAPFVNDASPSRPLLYKIEEIKKELN